MLNIYKKKKEYKKLNEQEISDKSIEKNIDKGRFQQDMVHEDITDFDKGTVSVKVLCNKAFETASNS